MGMVWTGLMWVRLMWGVLMHLQAWEVVGSHPAACLWHSTGVHSCHHGPSVPVTSTQGVCHPQRVGSTATCASCHLLTRQAWAPLGVAVPGLVGCAQLPAAPGRVVTPVQGGGLAVPRGWCQEAAGAHRLSHFLVNMMSLAVSPWTVPCHHPPRTASPGMKPIEAVGSLCPLEYFLQQWQF